jgi:hypothetical protein
MKCEFKDSHDTLDELIAYHGDVIVGVKYVLDSSDDGPPVLEVTLQPAHYTVLRYLNAGEKWYLQAVTVDAGEHRKPPRDGVIDAILDKIRASVSAVKARV